MPCLDVLWAGLLLLALVPAFCSGQNHDAVDLPFGEINVLVLTDVHSWIGGHSSEPKHNADYGDILSFYERLHAHCQAHKMDLWFVVNGDWIDGTGLSLEGDISYLTPLLEKMPWDALNVGNHELYRTDVVHQFMRPGGFVESWGERYLSSNVLYTQRQQPLGHRYRFLRGHNATVLTFGFLYNMEDASEAVTVEAVEEVVEEQWFVDVVTNSNDEPLGKFDAIMVLAHMDVQDQLVTVLLNKIRSLVGNTMPVQFITGHTHYRGVHTMDEASVSFEAGRYLDTVGFVSFPSQKTFLKVSSNRRLQGDDEEEGGEGETPALLGPGGTEWPNVSDTNSSNTGLATTPSPSPPVTTSPTTATPLSTDSPTIRPQTNVTTNPPTTPGPTLAPTPKPAELFHYRFIDTDVATLATILGVTELSTEDGAALSEFIYRTRSELGLLDLVGCAPQAYYLNRTVNEPDSLWKVFLEEVAPYQLLKGPSSAGPNQQRMFLGASGGFRYDLAGSKVMVDDVIAVSPFNETIFSLGPSIPGSVVKQLVTEVLNAGPNSDPKLDMFVLSPSLDDPKLDKFVLSPSLDDLQNSTLYEIMAPEWGVTFILDGLKEIKYNGTVQQVDSGFASTDIWLQFVKDKWKCTEKDHEEHSDNQGGSHSDSSHHHSGGSSFSSSEGHDKGVHTNGAEDKLRSTLALIAVVCVVFLGSLYIWQLHRSWMARYRERQRLIFTIDEENDNELI